MMDKVVDDQKGVPIFAGDGIEHAIVLYESKLAILFLYEIGRASCRERV